MAVEKRREYFIPFVGLSIGNHRFNYLIDNKFFALFDTSEIQRAKVNVELDLDKEERMLVLNFNISGTIGVTCSRCLDEFDLEVEGKQEFFVKFGNEFREEDGDVLIIPENESHIDISGLIFDYLHLMIPFRVVHPDDKSGNSACDPEVIKRLNELTHKAEQESPWSKLKDINLD
ncbi:MAG: DUF177 domain-containing protein [Lentimicrobium sp.]|nr:DUF177 domain-containing protein [Lentimicrobium sp.]